MTHHKESHQNELTQLLLNAAAYRKSHILLTAIGFDVFTILENFGQAHADQIAQSLGLKIRNADKLMGGLVALGLVDFDGKLYRNQFAAKVYLVRTSPYYLGDGIRTLFDIGQDTWKSLTHSMKEGKPIAIQRTDEEEADFWPKLTKSIRPFNIPVSEAAARLMMWKGPSVRKVLDLGGGSGVFGKAFLKHFPEAQTIQVDWSTVNKEAIEYNKEDYKTKRFRTVNGDLFETPWEQEGPFDIVILSHIIHQEDLPRIKTLIRRIGNSLSEDGVIIINEFTVNREKNYPPYGLIFGLSMALQNFGGDVYSYAEVTEALEQIGHEIYLTTSPVPPATLFFTRKKKSELAFESETPASEKTTDTGSSLPKNFLSREWDTSTPALRKAWTEQQIRNQMLFAREHSAYWRKKLGDLVIGPKFGLQDFQTLPLLFKSELRILDPYDLATNLKKQWHIVRGSGGTTGVPTTLLWTEKDWKAAIQTSARFLTALRDWTGLKIWNGYHQAHVAGPAFDDIIRMVGATPIPRHFKSSDEEALREMEHLKVDALVLTPKSGSGKGGSLEDFLGLDPDFIKRLGIRSVWVSSTPLDTSLVQELKSLGVEHLVNFYGSTESMPNAISCSEDPRAFHLCQGHIYLEVLNEKGQHVRSGERGAVVISRIGAVSPDGIVPAEGSQIFRFVVGDHAVYTEDPCPCGLKTPRIREIQRIQEKEEEYMGGCERWD